MSATAKPSFVSKLSAPVFKPKRIGGQPDTVREMVLGVLFGKITDFKHATGPDGDPLLGFKGKFEFTDADPANGVTQSGVLYLPSGILEIVEEACNDAFDDDAEVEIAFQVGVQRSDNPAGYAWKYTQLRDPSVSDPFAALRSLIAAPTETAVIVDKSSEGGEVQAEVPAEKTKAGASKAA